MGDILVKEKAVVLYKNEAAIISGACVNGKNPIKFRTQPATATKPAVYGTQNVRMKDFVLLHEGPA